MLNKTLKILFLLNVVLISVNVFAAGLPAKQVPMIIDTTSINIPKGDDYPKLLGTFEAEGDMVTLQGSIGPSTYPATASVHVYSPKESGKVYNKAKIFRLTDSSGSSNYGFTIRIDPRYKDGGNFKSFPGDYIKSGNATNSWIYASNQNSSATFKAVNIGAKITIQIFALQKTTPGISTITNQTLANLKFRADRGSLGPSSGLVSISINSFTVTPSSNTCKITSSDAHVINMKPVNIKGFPSIGSEVDGGEGTTIVLTCSEGVTSVKVGMTDITERNNISNQLKLDSKSTALGFSVKLYRDNGSVITYNPDPKTANNTWELSPSTSSSNSVNYNVPIKAKYYRVGRVISPGIVLANAAITFIYQ